MAISTCAQKNELTQEFISRIYVRTSLKCYSKNILFDSGVYSDRVWGIGVLYR